MDDPEAYKTSSDLRDGNHAQLLDEFAPTFNWRKDGRDSVMDIGCAGGDVTCSLILPKLPPTFSRLLGVDVNDKMINYASRNYKIPKVSFEKLDIGGDISDFVRNNGVFDHIISFFCFHLVPDQKLAMQNIYNLLGTNGDCFIHVIADSSAFDVYKRMYSNWSEYMVDIDTYVSSYYHRINAAGMLEKHLKNAGFKDYNVIEKYETTAYHDVESFIGAYKPIIPFFSRIPLERQSEFLDEYVQFSMEVKPQPGVKIEKFQAGRDVNIFVSYKILLVYARK